MTLSAAVDPHSKIEETYCSWITALSVAAVQTVRVALISRRRARITFVVERASHGQRSSKSQNKKDGRSEKLHGVAVDDGSSSQKSGGNHSPAEFIMSSNLWSY